uniref:Uncharacterized protein n=1 Tax=Cacopsylla melanoneura TaxID=428564 RepID=A0A8D8WH12_9HEMI
MPIQVDTKKPSYFFLSFFFAFYYYYYTQPHRISAITPISTKVLSNHLFNRKKRQVFFSPFSNISVVLPRTSVLFKVLTLNILINSVYPMYIIRHTWQFWTTEVSRY